MILKRVDSVSCGKLLGALYALMGLILGGIMSLFSVLGATVAAAGADQGPSPILSMLFGIGAVILLPLFYGIIGFVGGIIGAVLYNFAASFVGGIEIELSHE